MKAYLILLVVTLYPWNQIIAEEKDNSGSGATTKMDFESSMIDGKMKAPNGFLLQGRNKQSLTNMVKLRSNFSSRLRESQAAIKSIVK